jgi:hypothetical protein
MRNLKKSIVGVGFLFGILLALYFITPYLEQAFPMAQYQLMPQRVWLYVWTILLSVFFAFGHIKTWWENPGKFRINYVYLIFTAVLASSYLPIPGWPLNFVWFQKQTDVVLIVLWYSAFHIVDKGKNSYDYVGYGRL